MTQDELVEMLSAHEWRDIEFKEARRDVPRNAYETVSAFANTEGGHLVFGVRKNEKDFDVVGVLDVDKVQNDFISTLRQRDKISVIITVQESLLRHGNADLLIFHVPEAHRSEKPVFLNGDIRRSFVRSGGCDVHCSDNERNRFLLDAAAERYDSQPVDLDLITTFDEESIKWYRTVYEGRQGNRS
ncbi:MAG: ATP-binding protein, partial [Rhodospirillaceae bacterium]|nr:ATP-binding protein [Rhodospirillaceae bacterium]